MKAPRSGTLRLWDGVRMRRCEAARDPDADPRRVILPASWDAAAAAGLATLAPGDGEVALATLAERWLARLAAHAGGGAVATAMHRLLLEQSALPEAAAWTGSGAIGARLHLAAEAGEAARLLEAAEVAAAACAVLWPGERPRLRITGLAGTIAASGLDYDSAAARDLAGTLLRALRARLPHAWLGVGAADCLDALLGVETAGIAPDFGPLDAHGALSRASQALLAARATSEAAALASVLAGRDVLPTASAAAHAAMDAALAPYLDARPAMPAALPAPIRPQRRRDLPARRGGIAHKAVVGGQKVFLRTGEYPDGRPGEVAITLPQATPAVRALVECLSHAIGIGLQHGAPLAEFVDALAGSRFGPSGAVEGDPAVARATSAIDYVMRHLAHAYLPSQALPPADADGDEAPPLLPLELPHEAAPARRRGLRVVK